jgi:zinc protease
VPDASSLQDSVALIESIALPVSDVDRYKLVLGNLVLGGGFASRLYRDLRTTTGYVYSVSSRLNWTRTRGYYLVSFGSDPQNVDKARLLIQRDLRDMQTAPINDAELTRAKAEMLRRLPMQRASVRAIAGSYLSLTDLGLPLDSMQIAAKCFLDMTAPQIQQAFATWLRPDALAQIVKGPALAP